MWSSERGVFMGIMRGVDMGMLCEVRGKNMALFFLKGLHV